MAEITFIERPLQERLEDITGYDLIICPYCEHENSGYDLQHIEEEDDFEYTCENCGNEFMVYYQVKSEFEFSSYKKKEVL